MMTKRTKTGHALGTRIVLTVYGEQDEAALDAAFALIESEEDRLTVNRDVSEVMSVNHAAGQTPIVVSSATYRLIAQAVAASRENFGFNALIGPLVKLWHIGFTGAHVPTADAIAAKMALIDPAGVALDPANHSVALMHAGMELDLGGIAKGYIADQIRSLWRAYGVAAGIIDLGGNLLFVGDSPRRTDGKWVIGVQDPAKSRHTDLGVVVLPACSAVTSGIYERFLELDGHRYHHLLDPRTGSPLETELAGVTVFTQDSIQGELEAKRLFFHGGPVPGWRDNPQMLGAVFAFQDGHVETDGLTLTK
ncbi:FAD:protein FMN transferase [Lacticaseibacillus nasuensis]|uniref:FAD:protein FMN transferase n=1 Tax=Lacticaseibacillus nasuensis TaxID=944671 RepID=UPI0022470AA4|nr:FAD:protein FMN transferase [Lacticaseibacillus nasuensis]MCX2456382.1 FAD:protein FMN transferase [Lacticaseibacillus nasuensis]